MLTGSVIEQIAEQVVGPDRLPLADVAGLLADGVDERTHGRLAELAVWWAEVRPRPGGPIRVLQVGGREQPAPAGVELARRSLDQDEVDPAVAWGVTLADEAADGGVDLVLLSLPDHVAARVLAGSLMDLDPVDVLGWPGESGLDDAAWTGAVADLRDGLRRMHGLRGHPDRQLAALGSPAMAAGAGLLVQSALRRTPLVLDGFGAAVCALMTRVVARPARDWWLAAQAGTDDLQERAQTSLRLDPLTGLALQAEDGTAARLGLDVLLAATRLLRDG